MYCLANKVQALVDEVGTKEWHGKTFLLNYFVKQRYQYHQKFNV
jgi:hypothetical protein